MHKKKIMLFMLVSFLVIGQAVFSQVQTGSETLRPMIVVFYEEGCPDCVRMEQVLEELLSAHPNLTVARFEINEPGAAELWWNLSSQYGVLPTTVPAIFVGEEAIVGAGRAEEIHLRSAIEDCLSLGCPSPLAHHVEKPFIPWRDLGGLIAFFSLFLLFFFLQGG